MINPRESVSKRVQIQYTILQNRLLKVAGYLVSLYAGETHTDSKIISYSMILANKTSTIEFISHCRKRHPNYLALVVEARAISFLRKPFFSYFPCYDKLIEKSENFN